MTTTTAADIIEFLKNKPVISCGHRNDLLKLRPAFDCIPSYFTQQSHSFSIFPDDNIVTYVLPAEPIGLVLQADTVYDSDLIITTRYAITPELLRDTYAGSKRLWKIWLLKNINFLFQ